MFILVIIVTFKEEIEIVKGLYKKIDVSKQIK